MTTSRRAFVEEGNSKVKSDIEYSAVKTKLYVLEVRHFLYRVGVTMLVMDTVAREHSGPVMHIVKGCSDNRAMITELLSTAKKSLDRGSHWNPSGLLSVQAVHHAHELEKRSSFMMLRRTQLKV